MVFANRSVAARERMMRLKIAFYQRGTPCHGETAHTKPLGGTESAMIFMAEALAERGHEVFVFNDCDRPGCYHGVTYRSYEEFETFAEKASLDVFLAVRHLLPLLAGRWAKLQIYYAHDAYDQPFVNRAFDVCFEDSRHRYDIGLYSLSVAASFADAVFCVGQWQAETLLQRFQLSREKVWVVSNGVFLDDFPRRALLAERKRQIIYTSTPFRGLEHLLRYFPKIRKEVPDAVCAVLSGMQLYGYTDDQDRDMFRALYESAQQPGVVMYGPLCKSEMAKILNESRVFAYPNTFAETFCIAALEAQAAGLPVVTTDLAALSERVSSGQDGYLVKGHPSDPAYEEEFVARTISLLKDDALWESQSEKARQKSLLFSYTNLAGSWEELFKLIQEKKKAPARDKDFVPSPQAFSVLVDGYAKKIELSADIIRKHFCVALTQMGFAKRAKA